MIFKNLLLLLHPFLPFLSDHLFGELFGTELLEAHLDLPQWGQESEVQTLIDVISLLREARSSFNLSLIHISEPTRQRCVSRMPSSA